MVILFGDISLGDDAERPPSAIAIKKDTVKPIIGMSDGTKCPPSCDGASTRQARSQKDT
ncbi:hypothetical protein [Nostoc sp.]|uniref:hypothetical protein n=1 Tax=Nostoc sp. TaxID=1180 RepID=UPI002FFBEC18